MMNFLLTALAVLWAWETLLIIIPSPIPVWLQPFLVLGLAWLAIEYVPDEPLYVAAVGGAVLLMHRLIIHEPVVAHLGRTHRVPPV